MEKVKEKTGSTGKIRYKKGTEKGEGEEEKREEKGDREKRKGGEKIEKEVCGKHFKLFQASQLTLAVLAIQFYFTSVFIPRLELYTRHRHQCSLLTICKPVSVTL